MHKQLLKYIVITTIIIVVFAFILNYSKIQTQKKREELDVNFQECCTYVRNNERAFVGFSNYAFSLLDDDHQTIDLNQNQVWKNHKDGIMVRERFGYIMWADLESKTAHYIGRLGPGRYRVEVVYSKSCSLSLADEYLAERYCIINDDLYLNYFEDISGRN